MDIETVGYYEGDPDRYVDRTRSLHFYEGLEKDLDSFAEGVGLGGLIADLGSGSGRDAGYFLGLGFSVIAVDAAASLLKRCCVSHPGVHPVCADITALPFAQRSIDGIWACASFLHLEREQIPDVIQSCFDILKPTGVIGISMKAGATVERRADGRLFTLVGRDELSTWIQAAGFVDVSVYGPVRKDWLLAIARRPT